MQHDEERRKIRAALLKTQLLGAPGVILIGLALYGLFVEGEPFHPLFADRERCIYMLVIGAGITLWETLTVIKLGKRLNALTPKP